MREKGKNIVKYGVSALIAVIFVWMVAEKVDWNGFVQGLAQTRWGWVALFVVASLSALLFRTLRWRDMLRPVDDGVRTLDTWDAVNVGSLANIGLPGVGELLRCALVGRDRRNYGKFLGTMVMERIWDVLAILLIILLALALKWKAFGGFLKENILASGGVSGNIRPGLVLAAAALIVLALGLLCWRLRERNRLAGKVWKAVESIFQGAKATLKMKNKFSFALYTALIWLSYIMMSWFGLKALPDLASLGFADALFISAVGNLASVIPVPSGMGPYHYLVMTCLSGLYACSNEIGLLYAVLCHESHAVLIIILGVASYIRLQFRNR